MNYIFALLLSVSPADRTDWPDAWKCDYQYVLCKESIDNLRMMRAARGYEDGRWDEWIRQTEEQRDAWAILATTDTDMSDLSICIKMMAYRELVGEYRYLRRYRPPTFERAYPYPPLAPLSPPIVGPPRPQRPNKVRQ